MYEVKDPLSSSEPVCAALRVSASTFLLGECVERASVSSTQGPRRVQTGSVHARALPAVSQEERVFVSQ